MRTKIFIQNYGSFLAIGIQGKTEDIIRRANLYYNYKVTNGEPIWLCDGFAYVIATAQSLFQGLKTIALVGFQGTRAATRIVRGGQRMSPLPMLAENKAKKQIESFTKENFLSESLTRCYESHYDLTPIGKKRFSIVGHRSADLINI